MDIGIERAQTKQRSSLSTFSKRVLAFIIIVIIILTLISLRVQTKYSDKILSAQQVEPPNIALVFGAGLKAKGVPGAVLEDRIRTAIQLYQDGRVGKILMSGDNSLVNHNEVQAMKNFALEQGLPEEALLLDHAGNSTLESCQRLQSEFNLPKIILVTQKYHLRRALYICNKLDIDAFGVAAEDRGYSKQWKFSFREYLASIETWFKLLFK